MIVYVNVFKRQIEDIKYPITDEELIFIRETIATMQGIIIAYIGFNEMEEVLEKAKQLQEQCYDLWHMYAHQER